MITSSHGGCTLRATLNFDNGPEGPAYGSEILEERRL